MIRGFHPAALLHVRTACRALGGLLLIVFALAFSPAGMAQPTVLIGTGNWVPYVDQHSSDQGAMARLIRAVFAEAGYRVEFLFYPWDRNVLKLQQGTLDAIMPYICT
jgi:polar amino acid transport system substrate-binding protein